MNAASSQAQATALPVAEYVRMSTDHQKYSIENQRALLQAYAVAHDMAIVRTYMDAGKSGLTLRGRAGLTALLADVVSGSAPFKAILVYDVSRWGRFQDADESAHYEFLCRRAGITMIYCAEQFASDSTPLGNVLKSLKRAMAGEFSRELGVKVSAGKARLGKMGFRVGGIAGYGLRRRLLVDGVTPGMLLTDRQWKSIQTDRVTLVPGPADELALVRKMYLQYVYLRRSEREIASALNDEGHTFYGRPWTRQLVRTILTNEKYIGNNIVGMVTYRLFTRQVRNSPEKWARCEGAFEAIVPRHLFQAAKAVRRFNEKVPVSREEILKGLRRAWRREGKLSIDIINKSPGLPSAQTISARFGSVTLAYEAVGYVPTSQYAFHAVERKLAQERTELAEKLLSALAQNEIFVLASRPGVLTMGNLMTIEVRLSRLQQPRLHASQWRIKYQRNAETDFIVAARLQADGSVKDYMLVPRQDLDSLAVFIRKSNEHLFALYEYSSLDAVAKRLADSFRRKQVGNPQRPGARARASKSGGVRAPATEVRLKSDAESEFSVRGCGN